MKKKHIKLVKKFLKQLKSGNCNPFLCNYLEFREDIPHSEINEIVGELAEWGEKNLKGFRRDTAFIYNDNEFESTETYIKNKIKHFKGFLKWHKKSKEFESKQYIWHDPDPIEGNDYRVSFPSAEVIDWCRDTFGDDYIITIQYNDGLSEAEVYISELKSIP